MISRRQFTKTAALGLSASSVFDSVKGQDSNEVIDIHQHVNFHGRLNEDLVNHQDTMGITRSVLLPSGSPMARSSTHAGKSNGLAARVFGTEASARLAAQYPQKFVYFCNEVPDSDEAIAAMENWLQKGALGIGEQKFGVDCDSAPMIKVYELAREYEVPVLLHFQHGKYNTGFERFHKVLERFPTVNFVGHAQTWWGNIDADHDQKVMYPTGPVTPGGLTDRYLSDYPNMFGDLSAGSGKNALARDEEHAVAFVERHQDKLCLGTDCADAEGSGDKCSGSQQIANVRKFARTPEILSKIFSRNARKIIRFS